MAVVLDASVAIAWLLRDRPGTPYADAAIERGGREGMMVPDLFWHEVRSALIVAERKGRIATGMVDDHMKDVRAVLIETDADHADESVSALARNHGLSGYDAAYLETAVRRGATLATLDKNLARAAASEGVASDWPDQAPPS